MGGSDHKQSLFLNRMNSYFGGNLSKACLYNTLGYTIDNR